MANTGRYNSQPLISAAAGDVVVGAELFYFSIAIQRRRENQSIKEMPKQDDDDNSTLPLTPDCIPVAPKKEFFIILMVGGVSYQTFRLCAKGK